MKTVNIHEAKTHLSRLIAEAEAGESFVIARAGRPLVMVTALGEGAGRPAGRLGFLQGRIRVPDDFDRMGEDAIAASFGAPSEAPPEASP